MALTSSIFSSNAPSEAFIGVPVPAGPQYGLFFLTKYSAAFILVQSSVSSAVKCVRYFPVTGSYFGGSGLTFTLEVTGPSVSFGPAFGSHVS